MRMKITYRQRLFCYLLLIFAIFAIVVIVIEQKDEKKAKTEELKAKLDGYSELIHAYISQNNLQNGNMLKVDSLSQIMPHDIRITVINEEGKVIYDKDIKDLSTLDNHLDRPEIMTALYQKTGTNIRMSASTQHEYIYYAKHFSNYFIRVALPYTIQTQSLLKAENMFIYIVSGMFVIAFILLYVVAGRFGKSISQLKSFTTKIKNNEPLPQHPQFPDDELGDIGYQLVDIFNQIKKNKQEVEKEREKLIQHFQFSETGLCIFTPEHKKIYANSHFIQYLNIITDKPVLDAESIFKDRTFSPVIEFIEDETKSQSNYLFQVVKNGKTFRIQTIVFDDKSFEVTIADISRTEKTRLLKQEMTNNIAHELRTPVTSLRGYLETLSETNLPEEKQKQFIERAYIQTIRLSNLIEDVSLISKIEEASAQFSMEKVNLVQLIDEVRIDLTDKLLAKDIKLLVSVKESLTINGNHTLLYSIFRNLIDNSISYGGQHIEIHINNYMEDDYFLYFSYYDTGSGVEEEHLNRLFERFYRVNEGRTRDTGGSGLGLSIVKNAIALHKGEIQAKNRKEGGLEFVFTLHK